MNVYKLNNKELQKYSKEFNKTPFGFKVRVFSMLPICIAIIFLLVTIINYIIYQTGLDDPILTFSYFSILISCVAQLQYGRYLKDYIELQKKSKTDE